ncbi:MAG: SgcJ/EcaC family oxidoreductase [Xenococcaceae cyanobacterium]
MTSGLVLSSLAMSSSKAFADSQQNYNASASSATTISDRDIEQLGQNWGVALASRDPNQIVSLYDKDAVLLATFNNELNTPDEIKEYFVGLTKKPDLKVVFNNQNIRILDENTVTNSGLYTFSYTDNGKTVEVPARYTFLYEKKGDRWAIVKHHSSTRPEK